jgi:hypothetical protein
MQMQSAKQVIALAKQSTDRAHVQELYNYALNKEQYLKSKQKNKRAAMWNHACIEMRCILLGLIADKPKPTIIRQAKATPIKTDNGKRQKNTGILLSNLNGLSTQTKTYLARSQGCTKRAKTIKESNALAHAYEQWKKYGNVNEYCLSPNA